MARDCGIGSNSTAEKILNTLVQNFILLSVHWTDPMAYYLRRKEIDFLADDAIEVKYRSHVSITEFDWAEKVLPKGTRLTVITKQTKAEKKSVRLVPLVEWLLER